MFFPMLALVFLTFLVGCAALYFRVQAVRSGMLNIKYFQNMQSDDVPRMVVKTTRCFNNLFEAPILFYVICCLYLFINVTTMSSLIFAWMFVIFRIVQVLIHTTYNNVLHRMLSFWLGWFCILALWINITRYFL